MHIIQEEIGVPKIKVTKNGSNNATFIIAPLPTGYGTTLGNALRRTIISSLPGAAVAGIKVPKITHEYTTIPGVKDSVLDIILNLKSLSIKKLSKEPITVKLKANKVGEVLAKNIETNSDISILNPDMYITYLTDDKASLEMDILIKKGVGYVPANSSPREGADATLISIDTFFSPVKKVKYHVEPTRVGGQTNLDSLILEIETNGAVTPEDALKFSAELLRSYFEVFREKEEIPEQDFIKDFSKIAQKEIEKLENKPSQEQYSPVELLGLSPRALNALINGGIGSIEQLTQCSENKLANLRGFGAKALKEVKDALATRTLTLKEDE